MLGQAQAGLVPAGRPCRPHRPAASRRCLASRRPGRVPGAADVPSSPAGLTPPPPPSLSFSLSLSRSLTTPAPPVPPHPPPEGCTALASQHCVTGVVEPGRHRPHRFWTPHGALAGSGPPPARVAWETLRRRECLDGEGGGNTWAAHHTMRHVPPLLHLLLPPSFSVAVGRTWWPAATSSFGCRVGSRRLHGLDPVNLPWQHPCSGSSLTCPTGRVQLETACATWPMRICTGAAIPNGAPGAGMEGFHVSCSVGMAPGVAICAPGIQHPALDSVSAFPPPSQDPWAPLRLTGGGGTPLGACLQLILRRRLTRSATSLGVLVLCTTLTVVRHGLVRHHVHLRPRRRDIKRPRLPIPV